MYYWNGIDVDWWAQEQTLNPGPRNEIKSGQMYTGYELLGVHWSSLIDKMPLDVRYQSFCRRLSKAKEGRA